MTRRLMSAALLALALGWLGVAQAAPVEEMQRIDRVTVETDSVTGTKYIQVNVKDLKVLLACEDKTNSVCRTESQFEYEAVAASQTDQVLGNTGAAGDLLHALVCVVSTAATAATSIKDGAGSSLAVFPNSPGGGIGTYTILLDLVSTGGAWSVTTGAGVACLGIGRFS